MALKKPGPYVALSAHYADDDKIMAAGEDAELLYIRMLAYCARQPTGEGWISDSVLRSRLGIVPRDSGNGAGNVPGTDAGSRAERLREVGLIARDDNGWRIESWLRWNRSAEEMGKERSRDRSRKHEVTSPDTGTLPGNVPGTLPGNGQQSRQQRSETETDTTSDSSDAPSELRPDVADLLDHLDEQIRDAAVMKVPSRTKKNADAARLLIDRDAVDFDQACEVATFATHDEFWSSNIGSMSKFREKYPQLLAKMRSQKERHLKVAGSSEPRLNGYTRHEWTMFDPMNQQNWREQWADRFGDA